ncbi:MAG: MFS transporter [Nitrosospira sp.]|nr:MFS transporter [Nitrosospira sp.]MSQ45171.1 MFS transporter [Nitrosomonadaceae bacterium]
MFDFANSGFTTVVITAIFNAYFVSVVAANQEWATLAWASALSVSYLLIILTAPLLGAYADAHSAKKRLLLITTVGCVGFTALLSTVGPGDLWLAILLIILANFFFGSGENLIAAFLPDLARGEALGRVSGWGWSLGYIGGLFSLGCSLIYVNWAQDQGLQAAQFVPITMLITALLFAASSVPTFLYLRERPHFLPIADPVLAQSITRLKELFSQSWPYLDLRQFLICLTFYQAGAQTIIILAAIYAQQVMGFGAADTIFLVLIVNITASFGAFIFGSVQDKVGHVATISVTLIGWILVILLAWAAEGPTMFWISANLAGLCLGASQSSSRALVGFLSPASHRAEFFGLWGLAVKLSSILGPITYGLISWITKGDHRLAMLVTGVYFIIGLLILMGINVQRGREAALNNY